MPVANERALLAPLSDEEQATLITLLRKLLAAYELEHPVPPPSGFGGRHKPRAQRPSR